MSSYQPIENYGVIGDLNSVALVGLDTSIDFLCLPDFDSPSVFAALLDKDKGGYFRFTPKFDNIRRKQMYLPDTNVLLTVVQLCPPLTERYRGRLSPPVRTAARM